MLNVHKLLFKGGLDGLEVWQYLRVLARGGVFNHPVLADDERRTLRDALEAQQVGKQHVIGLGDFLVEVGKDRESEFVLLGPGFLRERAVHADAIDGGAEAVIGDEVLAHAAHLVRADARESQREEQEHGLLFAEVVGEGDVLEAVGGFGLEGKGRSLGAWLESHIIFEFGLKGRAQRPRWA
jgi:hypothetical protein